jgi:hypothetical protein
MKGLTCLDTAYKDGYCSQTTVWQGPWPLEFLSSLLHNLWPKRHAIY